MLIQDIRYALRSFLRAPGFTAVALITLALGIGGTTAIFSIVDGVVLRPLPYNDPDRIVQITSVESRGDAASFSAPDFRDVKKGATYFSAIAGYRSEITDLTGRSEPIRVTGLETTAGFFDIFDAPPLLGRTYHENTDKPGAAVAVIGEAVWRQHFGGDPKIVGTVVRLNNKPTEIIGVVPARLRHPTNTDVWLLAPQDVPTSPLGPEAMTTRDVNYFTAVGRVAADRSLSDARGQLRSVSAQIAAISPDDGDVTFSADPLAASMVDDVRTALMVVLGAVGFVLLIACANVAGLLIARGASRRREIAVRTALGAGRGRLVRQLLTESLVLAVAGGLGGILVAMWSLQLLISAAPRNLPRLNDIALDWRVALFAFAATLVVGALFGLAPSLSASKPELNHDLKDGGRTGTARTGGRNAMVVAQVALALVLLIGAGLMLTSFSRLRAVDPGFRTSELVTVELMVPLTRYDEQGMIRFYTSVLERMRANPVTAQSALMFPFPFGGGNAQAGFQVVGQPPKPRDQQLTVELNSISPGYLQTSGVRLLQGRDFAETDGGEKTPLVALISESVVKEFGGKNPIGEQVDIGTGATIVGIVSDARRRSLDAAPRPAIYLPYNKFMLPYFGAMIRTDRGAAAVTPVIKDIVKQLDADLPIGDVNTIEDVIARSTGEPRFRSYLIAGFALLALVLAAVGVYGLISFTVTQRVPEIGVRLALGASPRQVFSQVIGQGLRLAAIGVVVGLVAAVAATTLVRGLLFNTSPTEPVVYISLSVVLLAMAALACYVPARRAMRVDPMTALRSE